MHGNTALLYVRRTCIYRFDMKMGIPLYCSIVCVCVCVSMKRRRVPHAATLTYHFFDKIGHSKCIPQRQCQMWKNTEIGTRRAINSCENSHTPTESAD